jgi:pyridoxamine 5'-phosphate oxidase
VSQDISGYRSEYAYAGLHEDNVSADPFHQFGQWFQEAIALNIDLANAMVVATADANGQPAARYVLLKEYSSAGFVFYTNSLSQKGQQLAGNPQAALLFYWKEMHRQIRIEGRVVQIADSRSDEYFASRPRGSQISAWVAPQSSIVPSHAWMQDRVNALSSQYEDSTVPRPPDWTGYQVIPHWFEFWQGQENRLHDRLAYLQNASGDWVITRLAP